jgi:RNA polymerase sigma-70 factor, ECF subfamily
VTSPEYTSASDAQLVVAVARADQRALAELYRRHGGATLALASRLLNDRSVAQDVVQEVFLLLWNEPQRFDPSRGQLRSWLMMKTHTKAVDAVRSSSSRTNRENRELNDRSAEPYDLELQVWDLAVADRVQQALGSLSEIERRAIDLAYFGGYSYREVASMLSEPEGTIKSRIRSGLKTMRRHLHDVGTDDHNGDGRTADDRRPGAPAPGWGA